MQVQTAAFVAGIVFGAVAVGSSSYVWIRHRQFGLGGTTLSIAGIALLGLSIWSGISIEISKEGVRAEFKRLEQRVDTVVEANEAIAQEAKHLAGIVEVQRRQFIQLTELPGKVSESVNRARLEELRRSVLAVPEVDVKRLEAVSNDLKRLREESAATPRGAGASP